MLPIFVQNVTSYFSKLYGEDDFAKAAGVPPSNLIGFGLMETLEKQHSLIFINRSSTMKYDNLLLTDDAPLFLVLSLERICR